MTSPSTDIVLDIPEVAAALKIRPRAVHDLIRAGALAHFRLGTLLRVSRPALDEFIRARETNAWVPRTRASAAPAPASLCSAVPTLHGDAA
jgi:excisionase family DNA binding protein